MAAPQLIVCGGVPPVGDNIAVPLLSPWHITGVIVGFGIKTRDDIIWFNKQADGAVIGSEIIKIIDGSKNPEYLAKNYIKELKGKLWI